MAPENYGHRITFEPTGVNHGFGYPAPGGGSVTPLDHQPTLSYRVRVKDKWDDCVELSTGEELSQLNGAINIFLETGDDRLDSPYYEGSVPVRRDEPRRKVIGSMNYVPAFDSETLGTQPASYDIRLTLPKVEFDELLVAARLGRLPSDITIEVLGMEFGLADGRDIQPEKVSRLDIPHRKWDNKAFRHLDVVHVDFYVPLIIQGTSNDLSEKFDRLATTIETGLRSLLWAVLLIGVLILILRILR